MDGGRDSDVQESPPDFWKGCRSMDMIYEGVETWEAQEKKRRERLLERYRQSILDKNEEDRKTLHETILREMEYNGG